MLSSFTQAINDSLKGYSPVQVILGTLALPITYALSQREWSEDLDWLQDKTYKILPKIPLLGAFVKNKLDTKFEPELDKMDKNIHSKRKMVFDTLPKKGINEEALLRQIEKDCDSVHLGDQMSGAIYRSGTDLDAFNAKIFAMSCYTNPLHAGAWPNIAQREAEVLAWCSKLYNGDDTLTGTITSGGTGSIMEAMRTYKEWAKNEKGITRPNIIIPSSAHAAFEKAARTYGIKLIKVPVNAKTGQADVKAMESKINGNTIAMVGSAPSFPTGTIDPIEALSKIALKRNIGLHVDACLGGFLIPFAKKAGYPLAPFDFSLPGVTSISMDTHKYGQAPKGSSVILMRKHIGKYQPYVLIDSEIGMYVTPDQPGSRCGANILMAWGTLALIGEDKYVQVTRDIIRLRENLQKKLRRIPELTLMGTPQLSVIAFHAKDLNIYQISHKMKEKGWHLNNIQKPAGTHLCLTAKHLEDPKFADRFINDLTECVKSVKANPQEKLEGDGATYATMAQIPAALSRPLKEEMGREFTYLSSRVRATRGVREEQTKINPSAASRPLPLRK